MSQDRHDDGLPGSPFQGSKLLRALAGWLLGLSFLSYGLWLCVTKPEFSRALQNLSYGYLVFLLALLGLCIWVNSRRYLAIFRHVGLRDISNIAWFRVFVFSRFFNTLLGQSGNIYRAMRLKRGWGFSYTSTVSCYAGFAWLDTLLNTFLMSLALLIWDPALRLAGCPALLLSISFFCLLLAGLPVLALIGRRIPANLSGESRFFGKLFRKAGEALRSLADIRFFLLINAIGLVSFFLQLLTVYAVFLSLGHNPGAANLVIFVTLLRFSTLVVLTPGNLGLQEMACAYLASAMGMDMSKGLLVSGLLRIVDWINLGLIAGVLAVSGLGADPKNNTGRCRSWS